MPLFGPPDIPKLKKQRNIKGLIKALNYRKDKEVRAQAVEALGKLRASDAIPELIQALKDPEARVTIAAEKALSGMAKTAVPALIQALADPELRQSACGLLGKSRAMEAAGPLTAMLKDEDENLRAAAVQALDLIGDGRVRDDLVPLLNDPSQFVRERTAKALKSMDWLPPTKADQARLLAGLKKWEDMPALGKAAVPTLIEALNNSNFYHARDAAQALGKIGDPAAVDALIGCLENERFEVQMAGAEALGQIGDRRAVVPLIDHFDGVTDVAKTAIIKALGQLGGKEALDMLIKLLEAPGNTYRRSYAASALGETGDPLAATALTKALTDEDWMVRKSALESLEAVGGKLSLEDLIRLAKHHDRFVAEKAIDSLGDLRDPQALDTLIELLENPERVEQARNALMKIGKPAVPILIDTVQGKDSFTQGAAIYALGEIGSKDAVPALVEALRTGTWPIRIITAKALGNLGWRPETEADKALSAISLRQWDVVRKLGAQTFDLLMDALTERSLRVEVLQALGDTGQPQALDVLLRNLEDPSWQVRNSAAQGLIALHQSAALSDEQKRIILQSRTFIRAKHEDRIIHQDYAECAKPHTDERNHHDIGIGLDFPL